MTLHYTALVTMLSMLLFFFMSFKVGQARGRYNVQAPATTGNPDFERVFRVHYNTMESLVLHLPSMWLFAVYISDCYAAILGGVWIVGRVLYAKTYYVDASKRGPGVIISTVATAILMLGALGALTKTLLMH
jgi:glutathione S-transferase